MKITLAHCVKSTVSAEYCIESQIKPISHLFQHLYLLTAKTVL